MTIKEAIKERDRLNRLIQEYMEGRFLKHDLFQAECIIISNPTPTIKFRVKMFAQHQWRTIFYADGYRQAVEELQYLKEATEEFLEEFLPWAKEKEEDNGQTEIH